MSSDPAPIRIEVVQAPPAQHARSREYCWKLETGLGLLAKLLPGLVLVAFLVIYSQEISHLLRNASKVEAFGFKLEKEEFKTKLEGAAIAVNFPKRTGSWTDVPFRKLQLAAPLLKRMRILWVDDHPENNFFLRRILSDVGVHVFVAMNNKEGLDAIKRQDFALIISDFNRDRPLQETGGDLALEVHALHYDASFLFYTSSPDIIPDTIPKNLATNDPSVLLSMIAETAIERMR